MENVSRIYPGLLCLLFMGMPNLFAQDATQSYVMSRMYLGNLQPQLAMSYIQVAIELDETQAEFYILRAFCWKQLDRSDLFLQDFNKALAMNPTIMADNFIQGSNLPELLEPPRIDPNPFVSEPGETDDLIPQSLGLRVKRRLPTQ